MSMGQGQLERRAAQRFPYHIPVAVRLAGSDQETGGFTQDLSAKGVLICTDIPLSPADAVELTLAMPGEITLAESMRVRCLGRVVRVHSSNHNAKYIAAIHLERYEFLPEDAEAPFRQISSVQERQKPEMIVS